MSAEGVLVRRKWEMRCWPKGICDENAGASITCCFVSAPVPRTMNWLHVHVLDTLALGRFESHY